MTFTGLDQNTGLDCWTTYVIFTYMCDWIWEKLASTHIYKYVEIQFWNIKYKISWEGKEFQPGGFCSHTIAIWRPPEHSSMSDRPKKQAPGKQTREHWQWYTYGLLVHWRRNRVVVKSQPCHCVCGSQLLSNSVTYKGSCDLHGILKHRRLLVWVKLGVNGITSLIVWFLPRMK